MQSQPLNQIFTENLRPQFHFTPAAHWINDPNGLVFYKGKYHLFFQHNPSGNLWGNMSWGHSVSSDLTHWEHLPVAINCTDTAGIFSGSAVIDYKNTSGFGSLENPPMIAIYTVHQNDGSNQSQHIAYSLDEGTTWIKYANNPVLDEGMKDFRDPKVSWDEQSQKWLMTVAKPLEYKIAFYQSDDLKSWQHLSDFGPLAAVGGCWECPDLFQLTAPDGEKVWVLIVSLNPGGIAGGSGTQYFIGDWDGTTFTTLQTTTKWIDYGRDNYAGVTFSNVADNRRIFIAWMSNWDYASKYPSPIWRGQMSAPRELQVIDINGDLLLTSHPIAELVATHDNTFSLSTERDALITIGDAPTQVKISFDSASKKITIDRSAAWFAEIEDGPQISAPVVLAGELQEFTLRTVIDHGSLELFIPEAGLAMTSLHTLAACSAVLQNPAN